MVIEDWEAYPNLPESFFEDYTMLGGTPRAGNGPKSARIHLWGMHGAGIGIVLDGTAQRPGGWTDEVARELKRRAPGQNAMSTTRKEADVPKILSGYSTAIRRYAALRGDREYKHAQRDYADL